LTALELSIVEIIFDAPIALYKRILTILTLDFGLYVQTFFHVYVICMFVELFAVAALSHRCSNNTHQNLLAMTQTLSYCEHYGTLTDIDCMI